MKFKKGDVVEFQGAYSYSAKKGATAIVEEYYTGWDGEEYVKVKWIRNGLSGEQSDGGYSENHFIKVEEVSQQKEDRIFEEIKKEKVMEFKEGDILEYNGGASMAAKKGATAIFKGFNKYNLGSGDRYQVEIEWIRNGLDKGQMDGHYIADNFTKIGEVSTQKEGRIFEENKKDMKFNFNEGKQRVIDMLEEHIDDFEFDMLQDIRISLQDTDKDTVDQIEDIIKTIKSNTRLVEKAIEKVQNSSTVAEILASMERTCYEEMEETVLTELFGLNSITRED
jgi:hypothetical protein